MSNYPGWNNPYGPARPGYGYGGYPPPRANAARLVAPPAICLIVLYSISILLLAVALVVTTFAAILRPVERSRYDASSNAGAATTYALGQFVGASVVLVLHGCALGGAVQMLRRRTYILAMTTAVLAVIPICSALYVVGIPFGIWAVIVLCQPSVRQAFRD